MPAWETFDTDLPDASAPPDADDTVPGWEDGSEVKFTATQLAASAAFASQYATRQNRLFIPADQISLGAATPDNMSRVFVGNRPAIQFANGNSSAAVVTVDSLASGIAHWSTFGVKLLLSAVGADSAVTRFRSTPPVADVDGETLITFSLGGAGTLTRDVTMSGVTDRLQIVSFSGTQAMPGTAGIWRGGLNRNGLNAADTSTQAANVLGLILERAS